MIEDLILTGYHALLVPALKYEEREEMERLYGKMYNTDGLYRLPVCADKRAEIYPVKRKMTIYNFALESDDIYRNYGVYANGLLVENCSINYLNNRSQMTKETCGSPITPPFMEYCQKGVPPKGTVGYTIEN